MTPDEAYQLGQKRGREQLLEELMDFLGLREYIAKQIEAHERQMHDVD